MLGLRGHVMCYQCYVVFWPACTCNCPCQHALPNAQHTRPSQAVLKHRHTACVSGIILYINIVIK